MPTRRSLLLILLQCCLNILIQATPTPSLVTNLVSTNNGELLASNHTVMSNDSSIYSTLHFPDLVGNDQGPLTLERMLNAAAEQLRAASGTFDYWRVIVRPGGGIPGIHPTDFTSVRVQGRTIFSPHGQTEILTTNNDAAHPTTFYWPVHNKDLTLETPWADWLVTGGPIPFAGIFGLLEEAGFSRTQQWAKVVLLRYAVDPFDPDARTGPHFWQFYYAFERVEKEKPDVSLWTMVGSLSGNIYRDETFPPELSPDANIGVGPDIPTPTAIAYVRQSKKRDSSHEVDNDFIENRGLANNSKQLNPNLLPGLSKPTIPSTSLTIPSANGSSSNPSLKFEDLVSDGLSHLAALEPTYDMYRVTAFPANNREGTAATDYRTLRIAVHYSDGPTGPGHPASEGIAATYNGFDTETTWREPYFDVWPPSVAEGGEVFDDWLEGEQGGLTLGGALTALHFDGYPGPWEKVVMVKFKPGHDPEASISQQRLRLGRQVYYGFLRLSSGGDEWIMLGSLSLQAHVFSRNELPLEDDLAAVVAGGTTATS